jgi:predicted RNA polymerase sigma factor
VAHYLQSKWTAEPALQHLFSEQEILDDQLRMIFTCCHPAITADSQVALALKKIKTNFFVVPIRAFGGTSCAHVSFK